MHKQEINMHNQEIQWIHSSIEHRTDVACTSPARRAAPSVTGLNTTVTARCRCRGSTHETEIYARLPELASASPWNTRQCCIAAICRVLTQSGPDASAQSVGRVARLSRNVRQLNHVFANYIAGHKAERRPGAGEEWRAATKYDGVEVKSILINKTKVGQASCQVWSGNVNLPTCCAFSRRITASMSSSTSVALGPTDFNVRDTTHFGLLRHVAAKS
jgi:hypothetical protein